MKLDLFAKKSLENFLSKAFESEFIIKWDKVSDLVAEWIKDREKKEEEEKVDKWFESLPKDIKLSIAENLWYEMSYEDKIQEYTAE